MHEHVQQGRTYVLSKPSDEESPRQEWVSLGREVASLVEAGLPPDEAASQVGVEIGDEPLTKHTYNLRTPMKLVDLCNEIQAGRSSEERRRRQVVQDIETWETPVVSKRGLVA